MKITKKIILAVSFAACSSLQAADLTIINFGGANGQAQVASMYQPWQKAQNSKIIVGEYNGEMAKIKAMVDAKQVTWDLVDIETPELIRGCEEGLFETLPANLLNQEDYVKGAISDCGVGFFVWSMALGYDASKLKTPPTSWVDFWDVKKFPGKRGLRKGAKYTLEFALMADGVAYQDIYKVLATKEGQDRAFKKLDEISAHIQWWEAGAQPPQFLASGDVIMSAVFNGRIFAVRNESSLKIVWNGGIYDFDSWAIPKGSNNKELAQKFISFSLQPAQQKNFAQIIGYGPTNKNALALLEPKLLADLPVAENNIKQQLALDVNFWADYSEELEQRFNAWAAK